MSYHLMPIVKDQVYYEAIASDLDIVKNDRYVLDMLAKSAWSYCRQNDIFIPTIEQLWDEFMCCIDEHVEALSYEGATRNETKVYKRALKEFELSQLVEALNRYRLTFRIGNVVYNNPQMSLFASL
jgi:hypothetical protein